jgi:hypothetical protein
MLESPSYLIIHRCKDLGSIKFSTCTSPVSFRGEFTLVALTVWEYACTGVQYAGNPLTTGENIIYK